MKKGKKMKLELSNNYNVVSGTVDNKNPKAVYLTISAWGEVQIDNTSLNYSNIIKNLNKSIRKLMYENLDNSLFDHNKTIVDLDMRESGIKYKKRSYMNCEITLFKLNDFKIQNKKIKESIADISTMIITDVFDNSIYFNFHKKKS
jgi:hypothetical protein